MYDLAPMSIFINHLLYVSYSSLPNMGPGCYKCNLKEAIVLSSNKDKIK